MSSDDVLFVSDQTILIYAWITYGVLCPLINMFGMFTNSINIICFAKLGFDDSVNISLLGLAVSDLGISVMMVLTGIGLTPAVTDADLPFEPFDITYLVFAMPELSFARVSSCITAMITVERCLCITAPLKIKDIITPKRATVITATVFIIFFCSGVPVWTVNSLGLTFSPLRNKTLVGMISTADREYVEMMSFAINNFCIPLIAFVIIVVCTSILAFKLRSQSKWRQNNMSSSQVDVVTSRNQKAAKMVVMISTLFIVCFIPVSINMLALGFVPDLSISGKYFNITIIITGLGHIMENINSSMNIFIYYHMSSKYKDIFQRLFFKPIGEKIQNYAPPPKEVVATHMSIIKQL